MFDIRYIELGNFKSYRGRHSFKLHHEPGLYFLTGENQVEPQLGSNGAGKSTLLDAIYWCLFGRTLRGLKAGDILPWEGGETSEVILGLTVGDSDFEVSRTQSPNSLTVDGNVVTQAEVEVLLGLNPRSFTYSVIMPQFGQSFFELKPADKLTLFSQILGLDFWLERSEQAAHAASELEFKLNKYESNIQGTKDAIASLINDIENLRVQANGFEDERKEAIAKLDADIQATEIAFKRAARHTVALSKIALDNKHKVDVRRNQIKQVNRVLTGYTEKKMQLVIDGNVTTTNLFHKREQLEKLDELGAECPTCLQIVDQQHLTKERKKLLVVIEGQKAIKRSNEKTQFEIEKFIAKTSKDSEALNEALTTLLDDIMEVNKALAKANEEANGFDRMVSSLKKDKKHKAVEANPYSKMLEERRARRSQLGQDLSALMQKRDDAASIHDATKYWITGFKRIRLFILEDTLRTLELEVNNALLSLGLSDWQVTFDVERENKSGGVTKGFVVFVTCPSNPEPVRWECWSGGETQRLQLAGDFGLANLIMTQAGLANTIEFYDEPSEHLSDEGLVDLAETLLQRAISTDKRIVLVDHRMPEFGEFMRMYKVIKDAKGSHIEDLD